MMAHDSGIELKGARFLITGGSGFVGTHLIRHLLAEGAAEVRVYDKASSPVSDARIRSIAGDILDGVQLREAMRGVDGVFHLAVLPLGPCEKDRQLAFQVNVRGTF